MSIDGAMRTGSILRRRQAHVLCCGGARIETQASSSAVVVKLAGWVDASNLNQVIATLRRFTSMRTPLILDLTKLEFLGISAFRALFAVADEYCETGLQCVMVDGPALRPYTKLGAQSRSVPIVDSAESAHSRVTPPCRPPVVARDRTRC
ncbi:STAS domain-containing protein [Mycobacterium sp. CPCC 205372]|uniref:STAS domain-containing protein n=1 Tax=Mycobacterium hippophais TaxID=3016340 RepID=A0ABT4PTN2_9MYCO|nr:STAS domain-containing protein [Mycobacterium hippophais]MCZ8379943.1 STAS domain-containing protein [Mycobacterium hippophais]